ncbi:hypothetical protein E4J89_15790 [Arthrobacter sp. CAU 1506]|uniref:hypothetical protein n=1 Tax=Arthrobacter sp. CAU 1506 TaxID=2560052 RepID=UPI0010AC031A|nr:hypothetical protein [Arthrobacter sp. CAU 1506]TJY67342.1 hypothetical protein E4J89_15790 [Arthrobacter sp. CAU 1506]
MSSKSLRDIQRVLAGDAPYDDLDEYGQAIVRADWDEQVTERLNRLDLAAEFRQSGRSWSEADEQGSVVVRGRSKA